MTTEEQINQFHEELWQHNYNYSVLDQTVISEGDFDTKLKELEDFEQKYPEFYNPSSPSLRGG